LLMLLILGVDFGFIMRETHEAKRKETK
jgi:hypothetical protein